LRYGGDPQSIGKAQLNDGALRRRETDEQVPHELRQRQI
jgi:hypothetical protein